MIFLDSAIDIKDLSQKSEITVLFLEIRIIGDKHIYIFSPIVLQMEIRQGQLLSRWRQPSRRDVNYKCCYSNSYVQTVTDIHSAIKKRRFNLVLKPNNGCYAFSVFYLDVVDLGLNTYSLWHLGQVPVKMLFNLDPFFNICKKFNFPFLVIQI
jgi:hypothetical protein